MTFLNHFNQIQWDDLKMSIHSKTTEDVEGALQSGRLNYGQFLALISPAAEPYLEAMAQKSMQLTRQRFGNTLQLYLSLIHI